MSRCPACKNNAYMKIIGWTSERKSTQKILNQKLNHDIVLGALYGCYNTTDSCCKNVKSNGNSTSAGRLKPKTYTSYHGDLWKQFPAAIQQRYLDYISDISDRSTQQMLSPGFCDRLLFCRGTFEEFSQELTNSLSHLSQSIATSYRNFIEEEIAKFPAKPATMTDADYERYKTSKWPILGDERLQDYFKMPTRNTVIKMFEDVYEKVEPFLLRDLLSRHGGRFVRVDGTYSIMKKTMNVPDAAAGNNCMVKILGEYNHVLTYAFAAAENNTVKERLLYYLRRRYLRIGGRDAVDQVVAGYDDLCCNNGDPQSHFLPRLFDNCK